MGIGDSPDNGMLWPQVQEIGVEQMQMQKEQQQVEGQMQHQMHQQLQQQLLTTPIAGTDIQRAAEANGSRAQQPQAGSSTPQSLVEQTAQIHQAHS